MDNGEHGFAGEFNTDIDRKLTMARILIVDDDPETCTFVESLLAGPGRDIVSASDPVEAIARVRREPFDLLISDINLNATQTGLDVLRAFKAQLSGGQAVLISGFGTLDGGTFQYGRKMMYRISSTKTGVCVLRTRPTMAPGPAAFRI